VRGRYDKWLLLIMAALVVLGLVAVYSSTSVITPEAMEKCRRKGVEVSQFLFVKKQFFTLLLGLMALFAAYKVRLEHLRKAALPLLVLSLVCLVLVFTPLGISAGGARRWLRLWPSTFQPSELVKLAMVLFLAWYMSLPGFRKDNVRDFLVPIAVMGVFQVIFIKQPDFGAVMSLAMLTLAMLFLAGVKLRYLMALSVLGLPVVVKLVSEPYRLKRVTAFLDPWKDPQGTGFQLIQSFIALGSGGLAGVGPGESKQKLAFLPEVHTDFIFSLIGEELGFLGAGCVVLLFVLLFLRGLSVARNAQEPFSHYVAFGISFMIALQALINFAVVTGMVPTKGLPLPFISYGGSSLIVNLVAVGLLLNISARKGTVAEYRNAERAGTARRQRCEHRPEDQGRSAAALAGRWQKGYGYRRYGRRTPGNSGACGTE